MRIDLPCCGFKNCRHCFDGNCMKPSEQGKCEYWYLLHEEPNKPEPQWIPCSERLPVEGREVICQCRADIVKVLKLDRDGDWYQDKDHVYMQGFVIAWMPLPSPYQPEEESE